MARVWTKEQLSAIETTDRTLLVSAAAGSGKTATLTERIIRTLLLDDRATLSDMLIVTFTNAAVAELRQRIETALKDAVKERGGDIRLERELLLLPSAKISTIDAFCCDILRQNAEKKGLSPSFRIADPEESELLCDSLLDGLISALYEGELPEVAEPEEFDKLSDCLTDMKDRKSIIAAIRYVYSRAMNTEDGVNSLLGLIKQYEIESIDESVFGKYIAEKTRAMAGHYIKVMRDMSLALDGFGPKADKHRAVVSLDLEYLKAVFLASGYNEQRELMKSVTLENTPSKLSLPAFPPLREVRLQMKEDMQKISKAFFSYDEQGFLAVASELSVLLGALYRLIKKLDEVFRAEKIKRDICEYSDIERYTYECLWESGELTDFAISQREMYTFVYIDEYQDVNSLQARIFEAITRDGGGFMVGDIKQSIYGFRNAAPRYFAEKKESFPPLNDSSAKEAAIFMSNNFRCDRGIIDLVNSLFDRVFPLLCDGVAYSTEDALVYSKTKDTEPQYRKPVLCPVYTNDDGISQPELVARKIHSLINGAFLNNGERVKPSDIAILMRSVGDKDEDYISALTELGIPVAVEEKIGFFDVPEVLLIISLLSSVDNPRKDSELCALMCSTLFSFTPDELVEIKKRGGGEYLYDSLLSYTEENPDFKKGTDFISALRRYRAICEGMSADALLLKLYRECGIFALAAEKGNEEYLIKLYDYARSFEASSFKGLYSFINYIGKIRGKKRNALSEARAEAVGAVRIQTVHSSKGLEYPIVFLCDVQSPYKSSRNSSARLLYDENFGIGMLLRTPSGLSRVNNPMRNVILDYIEKKDFEEEMRVLYVALTRARERLYITGKPRKSEKSLRSYTELMKESLDSYSIYQIPSTLELLTVCSSIKTVDNEEFFVCDPIDPAEWVDDEAEAPALKTEKDIDVSKEELLCLLKNRLAFKSKDFYKTEIPEKLSVSSLYPAVLDGSEGEDFFAKKQGVGQSEILPVFKTGTDRKESAKKGIATHMFLQFCDLDKLDSLGAAGELARLVDRRFLSKADADRVRLDEIELFSKSELFSRMREAKRIWRELRFNVRLPADRFTEDKERKEAYKNETVLVQGVIDCIIEDENGGLHLVDYKTDRLTKTELQCEELARKKLSVSHSLQLSYYKDAIREIFGKLPKTAGVYSLPLGKTLEIDC